MFRLKSDSISWWSFTFTLRPLTTLECFPSLIGLKPLAFSWFSPWDKNLSKFLPAYLNSFLKCSSLFEASTPGLIKMTFSGKMQTKASLPFPLISESESSSGIGSKLWARSSLSGSEILTPFLGLYCLLGDFNKTFYLSFGTSINGTSFIFGIRSCKRFCHE